MKTEYQNLADKLSKLALEANAVAMQMERLEQAENDVKPKLNQMYSFLDAELELDLDTWCNDRLDNLRWEAGNVYLTEQEATNASKFKLAVVRINHEIDRVNKLESPVWVAELINPTQPKYCPHFVIANSKWITGVWQLSKYQFTFKDGCKSTIESVLKSHAADFDIVKKCGAI